MADKRTFGSPMLVQALDKLYGSEHEKESITLRESHDVSQFLKEKESWEKKSSEAQILFK
jgi:hypothetical protein